MKSSFMTYVPISLVVGIALGALGWRFSASHLRETESEEREEAHEKKGKDEDRHEKSGETKVVSENSSRLRVELSPSVLQTAGIELATAAGGTLHRAIRLPGEIELNADRVAHIVTSVGGIVQQVTKSQGDAVTAGELLVVLQSRELAEGKAAYLAAKERLTLADASYTSSEDLRKKNIIPELELLTARKERSEAQIELRSAENKLRALGLSDEQIAASADKSEGLARYEIRAPLAATIVRRSVAVGEAIATDSEMFLLADLTSVWVRIGIFARDLETVRVGTSVTLELGGQGIEATASISYLSPIVDEATRVATARAVIPNTDGKWRPGAFVTASLQGEQEEVALVVPTAAIQFLDNRPVVFVQEQEGEFKAHFIETGRTDAGHTEIVSGLKPGDRYVSKGAFLLKAELGKGEEEDDD